MTEHHSGYESILIVEDNPDDAELAVIALKQKGIKASYRIAKDGDEALRYALGEPSGKMQEPQVYSGGQTAQGQSLPLPPSLILLDLKLPGRGGIEVLKSLRAAPRTRYVPVVVLTTSVLEEDMIRSYESGANSFIRKPVDFSTFLNEIELICNYWLDTNLKPKPSLPQGSANG